MKWDHITYLHSSFRGQAIPSDKSHWVGNNYTHEQRRNPFWGMPKWRMHQIGLVYRVRNHDWAYLSKAALKRCGIGGREINRFVRDRFLLYPAGVRRNFPDGIRFLPLIFTHIINLNDWSHLSTVALKWCGMRDREINCFFSWWSSLI